MNVASILADRLYPELKSYTLSFTGLSFYADKDEEFAARLARRFAARAVPGCSAYLRLLDAPGSGDDEMEALIGELTIGETYFFRQAEHFDILRNHVFPDLLERNRCSRRLRIWSAGCATGAEPYSIEMLLELDLREQVEGWDVSILATDLNKEFLARARAARFSNWAFRETPEWIKTRCFQRQEDSWVLRPEFRRRVLFQHHNLASGDPPAGAPFDLIVCRNVMIYFGPDIMRRTLSLFSEVLAPGGWLLVGHAEPNITMYSEFQHVSAGNVTLYRKPAPDETVENRPSVNREPAAAPERGRRRPDPALPAAPPRIPTPAGTVDGVRSLADRGEWAAAAKLAARLIRADPLNPALHFMVGLIRESTASCAEAETALRRAIYLDRNFALAHYHLGTCLERQDRMEEGSKAFRNVLALLAGRPAQETVPHGDGMTVDELKELARMHLELLAPK